MQNQTKPKPSGASMAKLFLAVAIIVSIGAVAGVAGYYLTKQISNVLPIIAPESKTISAIEISSDKKSILNAKTKEVIFTIDEANKYLKDSGYAHDPDTFQDTNAKYAGDCFLDAALSGNKDRIVFSTGCLAGDLPQAWVGNYLINESYWKGFGKGNISDKISLLIAGSGKNFVWSSDNKAITYEADLGLSGMTETRTIDAGTGEVLERESDNENETADWKTYKNKEYGFEVKYPKDWGYEQNVFLSGSNLVFCPQKLTEVVSERIICKWKKEATKSQYEIGMIYLFNYASDSKPNNPDYRYLGVNNSGYYYLYSSLNSNESIVDQILSTFKFIEKDETKKVKLYYYNKNYDPKFDCLAEAVMPVEREITVTENPIKDTIKLLIEGKLTVQEKAAGFSSEFPHTGFNLLGTDLKDGVLTLKFTEVPSFTTGGSCRVGLLLQQVAKTAKQFPEVKEVRLDPEIFQP